MTSTMCDSFDAYLAAMTLQVADGGTKDIIPVEYLKQPLTLGFKTPKGEWLVMAAQIRLAAHQFAVQQLPDFRGHVSKDVLGMFFKYKVYAAIAEGIKRQHDEVEGRFTLSPAMLEGVAML